MFLDFNTDYVLMMFNKQEICFLFCDVGDPLLGPTAVLGYFGSPSPLIT